MKTTVTENDFIQAFQDIRPDNFSQAGLSALFEFLEGLEMDGVEYDLDVIAFCCQYTEYSNLEEFQSDYGEEYESIEDIQHQTTVIPIYDGGFIIAAF